MKRTPLEKTIMWLMVSLLAVSLLFCLNLLVVEYIRILILGMSLAIICITFPGEFQKSYARVCLIAGAYAYVLWLFDPAINGVAFFGEGAKALNFYRITSLGILLIATILWLFPLLTRKISYKEFAGKFTKNDLYVFIGILSIGGMLALMEMARAHTANTSVVDAALKGTKLIDCALVYILILRGTADNELSEKKRIYTLLYAFLFFCVFTSLVGAGRTAVAYYTVRIPPKIEKSSGAARQKRLLELREKLLRVFSLNSHEALIVYEAGYAAGQKRWGESLGKLNKASKIPRLAIEEEKLMAEIKMGLYSKAIQRLEKMPKQYRFSSINSAEIVADLLTKLKSKNASSADYYLAGLFYMHLGNNKEAKKYLTESLSNFTNNANALYFLYNGNKEKLKSYNTFEMSAAGWLHPRSADKSVEKSGDILTIVNNQQVEGKLWVKPGDYKITIMARDAGTPYEKAKASGFDPACKIRVWVDNTFESLRVISTNRDFNAYTFNAKIEKEPSDVIIEFTNDTYNNSRGWDRNVSISRIILNTLPAD